LPQDRQSRRGYIAYFQRAGKAIGRHSTCAICNKSQKAARFHDDPQVTGVEIAVPESMTTAENRKPEKDFEKFSFQQHPSQA
jgi:hypothetical protein